MSKTKRFTGMWEELNKSLCSGDTLPGEYELMKIYEASEYHSALLLRKTDIQSRKRKYCSGPTL
ncbi:MAG: hypothetical protein ACLTJG_08510 [[Clostridium] innocuum]